MTKDELIAKLKLEILEQKKTIEALAKHVNSQFTIIQMYSSSINKAVAGLKS